MGKPCNTIHRAFGPNYEGDPDERPAIRLAREYNEHTITVRGTQGVTNGNATAMQRVLIASVVALWNAGLLEVRLGKVWLGDDAVGVLDIH